MIANPSTVGDTVNTGSPAGTDSRRYVNGVATTEALAVTGNDYMTLTVSPSGLPTEALAFQSLTFQSVLNTSTAAANFFVRSSADGFAATLGSGLITTIATADTAFQNFSVPLTSIPARTTPIEFRIYLYGATTSDDTRIDNVMVNANVVTVPEPSSVLMIAGLGGLLALRRSRQNV
jgi:hypothetical protein